MGYYIHILIRFEKAIIQIMHKKLVITLVVVLGIVITGAIIFLLSRPSQPQEFSSIPGFKSAKLVYGDKFDKIYDITVVDGGRELHCKLNLKVDANGNLILPGKDEIFTTVLSEQSNLTLSDDSGKLGQIPGVFITKVDSKQNFHVWSPGKNEVPVDIETGKINNLSLNLDTIIKGSEGMAVSVTSNGSEIASGKLPLKLSLGKTKATATIDGLFVSQMLSSGLFHVFNGSQPVSAGTNTIKPIAQTVGNSIWFHKGEFVSLQDGVCVVADNGKVFYKKDKNDVSVETPDIDPSKGAVILGDVSLFWVNLSGTVMTNQTGKTAIPTSLRASRPLDKSGDYLIVDGHAYDVALKPFNPLPGWQWSVDGCFMKMDKGFLVCTGKSSWKAKAQIPIGSNCQISSKGKAFFSFGSKVSKPFELTTGQTEDIDGIVLEGTGEMNFPDGTSVKDNIQTNIDGKSIWRRIGWTLEKKGTSGVLCFNKKTGELELINADNGLKILFWNDEDIIIDYLDVDWLVFSLNGYTICVKRLEVIE
jgi:hypothetical protein